MHSTQFWRRSSMEISLNDHLRRAALLRTVLGRDGPIEVDVFEWGHWAELTRRERVVPQLYELASRSLPPDCPEIQRAEQMQLDVAATMVRLETGLVDVADLFESHQLRFAVLKGCATAHLDYVDPAQRQIGDVDLLISPQDLALAVNLLNSAGWHQVYPLPRHHELFTHALTFRGPILAEIDLHQRIAHRALGVLVPPDDLLERGVAFDVAGRELWALSAPDRLIHAALHLVASRGEYRRLSSAADVLLLTNSLANDAGSVLDRADEWRIRTIVEAGIRFAYESAKLEIPGVWVRAMDRTIRRRARLIEYAYLGPRRRPVLEELAHLWYLGSWKDRLLYTYGHFRMDSGPGSASVRSRIRYLWSRLHQRTR